MATSNAATTYLERQILDYLFKNDSLSFATLGNSIYVGLATGVTHAESGSLSEVNITTEDANYDRQQVSASGWKQSVTTLAGNHTNSQTEFYLADAEAFPSSGTIQVNDELITYTGKDGTATADANGAVTSSTSLAVDGNSGTITVGMIVTGTGISGTVKVATVTSQTALVLDTAITIADDTALTFDGTNTLTGCTRGTSSTTATTHSNGDTVISDQQQVVNDNNIEFAASSGIATYTVSHAFIADKNRASALVDGAVSSSTNVTVDNNAGTIVVGQRVRGTGITGEVKVATVTSQTAIVLDTAVTLADNAALTFDGNILFVGALDASKTLAVGDIFRINAGNLSIELK